MNSLLKVIKKLESQIKNDLGRFPKNKKYDNFLAQGIPKDFIEKLKYNKLQPKEKRPHEYLISNLIKVSKDQGFVAKREVSIKPDKDKPYKATEKIRADLALFKNNELQIIIEIETPSSSGVEIYFKDILNYFRCARGIKYHLPSSSQYLPVNTPKYWAIIYCFPDKLVKKWKDSFANTCLTKEDYENMCKNPHKYYKQFLLNPHGREVSRNDEYTHIRSYHLTDVRYKTGKEYEGFFPFGKIKNSLPSLRRIPSNVLTKLYLINLTEKGFEIDYQMLR